MSTFRNGAGGSFDHNFTNAYGYIDDFNNQLVAQAACESHVGIFLGDGHCVVGHCGNFSYYYVDHELHCVENKSVGTYEWVFANRGSRWVNEDYDGGRFNTSMLAQATCRALAANLSFANDMTTAAAVSASSASNLTTTTTTTAAITTLVNNHNATTVPSVSDMTAWMTECLSNATQRLVERFAVPNDGLFTRRRRRNTSQMPNGSLPYVTDFARLPQYNRTVAPVATVFEEPSWELTMLDLGGRSFYDVMVARER